jgi:predicted Zn-dependent protease
MERFAEAAVAYEKLMPSEDLAVKLGYATALLRTQRAAEARQVLEPLMAGQPSPEFQMTMGQAYLIEGLYDEAEGIFQQLYERQPDLGLLRLSLGSVYWKKRRTEEAIALWREDVKRHPESFEANYTLGAALALQEQSRGEAEALLRKAVRLKGQNARANYQLGKLLAGQGKNAEARGLLVVATTREPKYREAHYLLGMVCQKLGRAEEAKREFAIVQQLAKQDLERQIDLFDEAKP